MHSAAGKILEDLYALEEMFDLTSTDLRLIDLEINAIKGAQKFVFSATPDRAFVDFGMELVAKKLFRLPFKDCIYQFEHKVGKEIFRSAIVLTEFNNQIVSSVYIKFGDFWNHLGYYIVDLEEETFRSHRAAYSFSEQTEEKSSKFDEVAFLYSSFMSGFTAMLMSKDVEVKDCEIRASKRNRAFESPNDRFIIYKTVKIKPSASRGVAIGSGTHASPRMHWRRGHIRQLPSGVLTPVSPCLVGLSERGMVIKDYCM